MASDLYALLAVGLIIGAALFLLIGLDWRWSILALAVQYVGVFLLVWLVWPLEMAVVKLVAGWMSGAVLGTTWLGTPTDQLMYPGPVNRLFRILTGGLVLLVVLSTAPRAVGWVPELGLAQFQGGLILLGMGLLQLGFTSHPFRIILGLLTMLSGFEVIYAAVENSTLVAGLLGGINLGLALVGSYLLVAPTVRSVE